MMLVPTVSSETERLYLSSAALSHTWRNLKSIMDAQIDYLNRSKFSEVDHVNTKFRDAEAVLEAQSNSGSIPDSGVADGWILLHELAKQINDAIMSRPMFAANDYS
jgi:hypothetical protein